MKNKKLSRRKLLKALSASGLGLQSLANGDEFLLKLLNSLLDGCIANAHASDLNMPRNLVTIFKQWGAASFYCFNTLRPRGPQDQFMGNPALVTKLDSLQLDAQGLATYNMSYEVTPVTHYGKTIYMPWMFTFTIPTANGGFAPMSEVLKNAVIFRGLQNPSPNEDGHEDNWDRAQAPIENGVSLQGIHDDVSSAYQGSSLSPLMTTVSMGRLFSYLSNSGASPNSVGGSNYANNLFEAFTLANVGGQNFVSNQDQLTKIKNFQTAELAQSPATQNPLQKNVNLQQQALDLFHQNVQTFINNYSNYVTKYQSLIDRSIRQAKNQNLVGFFDQPLPGLPNLASITVPGNKSVFRSKQASGSDLRSNQFYYSSENYLADADLRNCFDQAEIRELAKKFALTQLLLEGMVVNAQNERKPLSSNVYINFDGPMYNRVLNLATFDTNGVYNSQTNSSTFNRTGNVFSVNNQTSAWDNHTEGRLNGWMVHTLTYRAFCACLYELQQILRSTTYVGGINAFDWTVINITSEMGRKPNLNEMEHAGKANCGIIMNGMLKFNVFGDIEVSVDNVYPGTWGQGKNMRTPNGNSLLDGRPLYMANYLNTICNLCRLPYLTPNNPPLITINETLGVITYHLAEARNG